MLGSLRHAKISRRITQKDQVFPFLKLLEVVRLVDGALVLVEGVDHVSLETYQHALKNQKEKSEIVVCNSGTFGNNFAIENDFTKYLKESCW